MSKLHIKSTHSDHSFTQSTHRPCFVVLVYALPVCVAACVSMCLCVVLYLSPCVGKIACLPGETGETSNMGAMPVTPWKNVKLREVRLSCPRIPAFFSRPPTHPQSKLKPVITQYIRAKPGNDMPSSKRPLSLGGNCSLPWTCLSLLHAGIMLLHCKSELQSPFGLYSELASSLSSSDELIELQL